MRRSVAESPNKRVARGLGQSTSSSAVGKLDPSAALGISPAGSRSAHACNRLNLPVTTNTSFVDIQFRHSMQFFAGRPTKHPKLYATKRSGVAESNICEGASAKHEQFESGKTRSLGCARDFACRLPLRSRLQPGSICPSRPLLPSRIFSFAIQCNSSRADPRNTQFLCDEAYRSRQINALRGSSAKHEQFGSGKH